MTDHNCFDHLDYDSNDQVEPVDEWYRCTICFAIYLVPEVDRRLEEEVHQ